VNLPHGAVITGCIVWGANGAAVWKLKRIDHADTTWSMGEGTMNSADTSITLGTIDNQNYAYTITAAGANGDKIYGATITYTTNYI